MRNTRLKETNSFYCTEKTDTKLRYSVFVPDDEDDCINSFNPIKSFRFQNNFRKTFDDK